MERKRAIPKDEEESLEGPTMNLAIINGIFYLITSFVGGTLFFTGGLAIVLFGFSINTFLGGLIWTPITSMFAHAHLPHLLGNMIFLFVYGFKLEERGYSDKGIYIAYVVTGLLASILSAPIIGANVISLGASGAVFGLLGVNAGIERRAHSGNYKSVLFASLILFILSSSANTNIFAHLFGLIAGVILGNSQWYAQFETQDNLSQHRYLN